MRASVLGAGYMGSAVTFPLCDAGWEVRLWGTWLDDGIIDRCRHGNHPKLKKRLPERVRLYGSRELKAATEEADILFIAVASEGFMPVFERYLAETAGARGASYTKRTRAGVVCALTKGFVRYGSSVCRISDAAEKIYGDKFGASKGTGASGEIGASSGLRWIAVGGPVKAVELSGRVPTATVYASGDPDLKKTAAALATDYYRICVSEDICGVELSAALKNIYAMGVGICDGMYRASGYKGLCHNYKALLFNQALREMALLVQAAGGRRETVFNLAGIGDLYVTSASGRNGRFGAFVGSGIPAREAYDMMVGQGEYVEGYNTLKLGYELAQSFGTFVMKDLRLMEALHDIIFRGRECSVRMRAVLASVGTGR